jgi:hypothetical protein
MAVDRAYTEVFGVRGGRGSMPPLIANEVRARAQRHYRRAV